MLLLYFKLKTIFHLIIGREYDKTTISFSNPGFSQEDINHFSDKEFNSPLISFTRANDLVGTHGLEHLGVRTPLRIKSFNPLDTHLDIFDIGKSGLEDEFIFSGKDYVRSGIGIALYGSQRLLGKSFTSFSELIELFIKNPFGAGLFTVSPLATDLNGDGVKTIGKENNIYFDLSADGFAKRTGWISADDGFLVYDRNENGIIDNGTELFGDYTPGNTRGGGFEALAQFDTNNDGVINGEGDDLILFNIRNS